MVFNRAERRDFHRSVASASIRSVSQSPSPPRKLPNYAADFARLGPLAACVASEAFSLCRRNPRLMAASTAPPQLRLRGLGLAFLLPPNSSPDAMAVADQIHTIPITLIAALTLNSERIR